jgi:SAM-dependent methyltransferase
MDEAFAREYPDLAERHFWWRARRKVVRRLVEAEAEPRSILDVGCGSGAILAHLEDLGSVEGVEVDPRTVRSQLEIVRRIHIGRLDEVDLQRDSYSIVLLLDVLEHVAERRDLLHRVGALLTAEGSLIVTVPAHQWLWTSHDEMNQHQLRYSKQGLRSELEAAGFVIESMRYLFGWLVLPKLGARLAEWVLRRPLRSTSAIPPAVMNRLLEAVSDIEMKVALAGRGIPLGTTLLAKVRIGPRE